ncbi:undecaprenyldiphospho-muramoylpentapeptide beta-N-acetylglucosaminyltransferase [Acetobacteraceae bacterium]|nr:undecaprenyldiphospho-muramoylpentapeptide beta-N-acetylglucosaminyltransferase [Acetobacteraceae bacterium]
MNKSAPNIILAAGGTGGHLFPAMSLGKALEEKGFNPVFMIDERARQKFEETNKSGWTFYVIKSGGIVGKNLWTRLQGAFRLFLGLIQAAFILWRLKPKVVIGFGGYPSLPPLLATKLPFLRKTLRIIHEGNAIAGTANRLLSRLGATICLSFPQTKGFPEERHTQFVGMPIRHEIEEIPYTAPYHAPSLNEKIHLLIVGGSLGAAAFSTLIPQALSLLPETLRKRISISQQAGDEYLLELTQLYTSLGITVKKISPFFDDMIDQVKEAHLIIGRAGGATVAEIIAAERPAIFIPLPAAAADEQTRNAEFLSCREAGWIISQKKLTENPEKLTQLLQDILESTEILTQTSHALHHLSQPQATQRFADFILSKISEPSTTSELT